MKRLPAPQHDQQAEAAKLDAATCPPKVRRRRVAANLKELGYLGMAGRPALNVSGGSINKQSGY